MHVFEQFIAHNAAVLHAAASIIRHGGIAVGGVLHQQNQATGSSKPGIYLLAARMRTCWRTPLNCGRYSVAYCSRTVVALVTSTMVPRNLNFSSTMHGCVAIRRQRQSSRRGDGQMLRMEGRVGIAVSLLGKVDENASTRKGLSAIDKFQDMRFQDPKI